MDSLSESAWKARFFRLWTLKEAYLKARGFGFYLSIEQVRITFDNSDAPSLELGAEIDDDARGWHLFESRPDAEHFVAVVVERGQGVGLRVLEFRSPSPAT